jgi:DNA mismatch repair ATPase MutS
VAATHDRELVALLTGDYAPAHLSDAIGADGLVFDYRLQAGPATTRNAIALLALSGASEALIGDARSLAAELDAGRRPVATARSEASPAAPG